MHMHITVSCSIGWVKKVHNSIKYASFMFIFLLNKFSICHKATDLKSKFLKKIDFYEFIGRLIDETDKVSVYYIKAKTW